jgi:hypothetical protein
LLQHGQGLGDKFSVDYILAAAKKAVGGTPATGVNEVTWLKAFLQARYNLLYNWDRVARVSVKRITMYQKLVDAGKQRRIATACMAAVAVGALLPLHASVSNAGCRQFQPGRADLH